MEKNEKSKQHAAFFAVIGIVLNILFGVLLHFAYKWSGGSIWSALLGGVNESTWEHVKLLYIPFFFMCIPGYLIYGKSFSNYFSAKLSGITVGILSIIVLYYTYTGIIGKGFMWVDITIFVLAVILSYGISLFKLINYSGKYSMKKEIISFAILILLCGLFFVFSFYPPKIELFMDPKTNGFGIVN